ncbi:hypothetical protein ACFL3L_01085 [Candidatus Neomarinimicrobiota bacterium]
MDNTRWLRTQLVVFFTILTILICSTAVAQSGSNKQEIQGSQIYSEEEQKDNNIPGLAQKDSLIPIVLNKEEQAKRNHGKPPGWNHGEKKGWKDTNMPPGLAKKGKKLPPGLAKKTPKGREKLDHDDDNWDEDDDDD